MGKLDTEVFVFPEKLNDNNVILPPHEIWVCSFYSGDFALCMRQIHWRKKVTRYEHIQKDIYYKEVLIGEL